MKNYYRILNVAPDASEEEIKRSFRILAKRYHPDTNKGDRVAARRFDEIHEAYTILADADARADYDARLEKEHLTLRDLNEIDAAIARRNQENEARLAQIQYRAQVQAEMQGQMQVVRDQAYKEGYARGKVDGRKEAENDLMSVNGDLKEVLSENADLKRRLSERETSSGELEQELFDRDRELAHKNEYIQDLEIQLQWLKKASVVSAMPEADPLRGSIEGTQSRIMELEREIKGNGPSPVSIMTSLSPEQQIRRNLIKEKVDDLNNQLSLLMTELSNITNESEQKQKSDEAEKVLTSMEDRALAWAKKAKADRQLSSRTLYGALGVLIWATDEEIKREYENIVKKYEGKSDPESTFFLKRAKEAYAVLSDPDKRKEYNSSLGVTEERIAKERELIAENNAVQDEFRKNLEDKEFWAKFDETSALAMAGNADAQNELGEIYYRGENVAQDFNQAAYWFREAFEQKHAKAIYNLAQCYLKGEGVSRNHIIGTAMLRQAANRGYTGN